MTYIFWRRCRLFYSLMTVIMCLWVSPKIATAATVEIPYVPLEISTFPDSLKKFCNDNAYGLQKVCKHLDSGSLNSAADFDALKYAWEHEKQLLDNKTDINAKMTAEELVPVSILGLTTLPTEKIPTIEEKLINGLGEFIVTRAKAEAAYFFQSELKKELCDKVENKEYTPNLCLALDSLNLSMSLNSMGTFLRSAVEKDIETLPDAFLKNASYKAASNDKSNEADILLASRLIYPAYRANRDGMTFLDILRGFSDIDLKCENTKGEVCAKKDNAVFTSELVDRIKMASVFMRAFEQNAYISDKSGQFTFRDIKSEIKYILVGFALSFDNLNKIKIAPAHYTALDFNKLNALLKKADQFDAIEKQMAAIRTLTETVNKPVEQPDKTLNYDPKLRLQERLQAMDGLLALMDNLAIYSYQMFCNPGDANCERYIKDLRSQLYKLRQASIIAKELLRGDDAAYMIAFLGFVSTTSATLGDNNLIPDKVKTVIPVMVEIANAKSSKDVANVLEAAAAPVGSYREKAKREMFSVTALFGATFAGQEYYTLDNEKKSHSLGIQAFAPLGVHYSIPIQKADWFNHVGLFLSVIDFGPIVSTDTESGVKSESNVGFKQLFSPGAYGLLHIYGPLNIGAGVSKTPEVIKSSASGDAISDAWRYQGFIAIDLTLFPF